MAGFFKQLDRHRRRLPKELEQYDDEYLRYCVEKILLRRFLKVHCMKPMTRRRLAISR